MKKISADGFYDFTLMFCLGLYILGIFMFRRLVSRFFNFVFVKYSLNNVLFIISLIFVIINLCVFFNRRKKRNKKINKQRTENDIWGSDFIILFKIYYFISMLVIMFSILNIVFSRVELNSSFVRKYNLLNRVVKEYSIESFNSVAVIPSYYTSRQGNSFRIVLKLYGQENFTFMDFRDRYQMLKLLQDLKKTKPFVIDKKELNKYYSKNVIYWDNEERKLFEEIFSH